jgi:hypothetical protein
MENSKEKDTKGTIVLFAKKANKAFPKVKDIKRILGVEKPKLRKKIGELEMCADVLSDALKIANEPLMTDFNCFSTDKYLSTHVLLIPKHNLCNAFIILEFGDVLIEGFNITPSNYLEIQSLMRTQIISLTARITANTWYASAKEHHSNFKSRNILDPTVMNLDLNALEKFKNSYALKALQDSTVAVQEWVQKHSWRNFN